MRNKKFSERLFFNKPFTLFFIYVVIGLVLGNLVGILTYLEIIPKELFRSIPKVLFGVFVIIIDSVCIWFIIYRQLYKYVDANGDSTVGVVEDTFTVANLKQRWLDEWKKEVSYCCIITYSIGTKTFRKEFPPTAYISPRELYPITIEVGGKIKLKYHRRYPYFCIIDHDLLKQRYYSRTKRIHIISLLIILLVTTAYVLYVLYG